MPDPAPLDADAPAPSVSAPKFDPKRHVIKLKGRDYLEVAWRIVWFRSEHPDWSIVTSPVEINMERHYAIFSATIHDASGRIMATATKHENVQGFGDFIEKAETGSVGRALAYCGYGTQFAPELAEGERLADSPVRTPAAPVPPPQAARPAPPQRDAPAPVQEPPAEAYENDDTQNNEMGCSHPGCTAVLRPAQVSLSRAKYGRQLCAVHQKDAASGTAAPTPTAAPDPTPERPQAVAPPAPKSDPEPERTPLTQEEIQNRSAYYNKFAQEAYRLGLDVSVTINTPDGPKTQYSMLKIGPLVQRATACAKPPSYKDWLPPVALLQTAMVRLPSLAPAPAETAPARVPVAAGNARPVDDNQYNENNDLTDPFAD